MDEGKNVIERKGRLPDGAHEIWLAGGCFWGIEKYMAGIPGVLATSVGYANGSAAYPVYQQVCTGTTGCAETVHVVYNPKELPLARLLTLYMQAIDPVSLNRQGADRGTQYRTGIYYLDEADLSVIRDVIAAVQSKYREPVAVEVEPLKSYYLAEEYHQEYLKKNPAGYCHISDSSCARAWNVQ